MVLSLIYVTCCKKNLCAYQPGSDRQYFAAFAGYKQFQRRQYLAGITYLGFVAARNKAVIGCLKVLTVLFKDSLKFALNQRKPYISAPGLHSGDSLHGITNILSASAAAAFYTGYSSSFNSGQATGISVP